MAMLFCERRFSTIRCHHHMDVEPKIGGFYPPKWMVKIMENPIKIDDLGVPLFLETPIYVETWVVFLRLGDWRRKNS